MGKTNQIDFKTVKKDTKVIGWNQYKQKKTTET